MLDRAFGVGSAPPFVACDLSGWPESTKALLRAAVARAYSEAKYPPASIEAALEQIPIAWAPVRTVEIPSEEESRAYQAAAQELPSGWRACALLPLATGLRAKELITLPRKSVERAAMYGELNVLRKGGAEQRLPAGHAKALWQELLDTKAAKLVSLDESPLSLSNEGRAWKFVGQILSTGDYPGIYSAFHRLVRSTGERAGLADMHPHLLRHCFATRMARDGAPLSVIQYALGHKDIKTTQRYVHMGYHDTMKYVRNF